VIDRRARVVLPLTAILFTACPGGESDGGPTTLIGSDAGTGGALLLAGGAGGGPGTGGDPGTGGFEPVDCGSGFSKGPRQWSLAAGDYEIVVFGYNGVAVPACVLTASF